MDIFLQILIILGFTCAGEILSAVIPVPIPASVYGLVLLFLALRTKLVKLRQVEKAGTFLISLLSLLFIAPVVNLLGCWDTVKKIVLPVVVIILVSTVLVFAVSGRLTQRLLRRKERRHD